jgi:hypothetical protein
MPWKESFVLYKGISPLRSTSMAHKPALVTVMECRYEEQPHLERLNKSPFGMWRSGCGLTLILARRSNLAGYNFISGGSALATLITPSVPGIGGTSVIGGSYTATLRRAL